VTAGAAATSLAVVDDFEIVHAEALGARPDTLFQAGSISKPVAALTALRLVEAGVLDLDEDVNDRLVEWRLPDGEGVTLRRLLSHTAGLGVGFFPGYESGAPLPSLVQILDGKPPARTEPVRVEAPPGSGFRYSGGGYVILQLLLEEATATPFAGLAAEHVLGPLGMTASTFAHRRGRGHVYPEQAAAGLWATALDLARFVAAVAGGTAPLLVTPQLDLPAEGEWAVLRDLGLEPPTKIGLGLFISEGGWFSHLGGAFGCFSAFFGSRESGRGVVVMTNRDASPDLFARVLEIADERGWEGLRAA
jgi:CubicO group peptidase (beta-lactamase class C family)